MALHVKYGERSIQTTQQQHWAAIQVRTLASGDIMIMQGGATIML